MSGENKFVATLPYDSGSIVGVAVYAHRIVVACRHGVYIVDPDTKTITKVVVTNEDT